jgi:SIR2-like domain
MPYHLLTGAGFTRNWGGWLANEAFEYLLGAPEVSRYLRDVLWEAKLRGEGFEGALSVVQAAYASSKSSQDKQHLYALTQAVIGMFTAMQTAFSSQQLNDPNYELQQFLSRFDSIFTLNQDIFLETHYLGYEGREGWPGRWAGWYLPYMRFMEEPQDLNPFSRGKPLTPDHEFAVRENCQPVYKLHGSYNWFAEQNGERLLVMGGNKTGIIKSFQVLDRYYAEFKAALSQPDTHLMIIGYSFGDVHVNNAIMNAASQGMKIFVIDPLGVDVIDKRNPKAQIQEPVTELMLSLMPGLVGASRRMLNEIIFSDTVEYQKVMRFFDRQFAK